MRCSKLSTFFFRPIGIVLALVAMPWPADAGTCKQLGLSKQCVVQADIKKNAINSSRVKNGSLTAVDLKDAGGADFLDGTQRFVLTGGQDVIETIGITAPTAGAVIVNVSGYFNIVAGGSQAFCSITTGQIVSGLDEINIKGGTNFDFIPFAGTRGFEVNVGTSSFNFVCSEFMGDINISDVKLTAMFFPLRY